MSETLQVPFEDLEDFWGRQKAAALFSREFSVFGRLVQLWSNEADTLTAVDHSLPLFSIAPQTNHPPFTFHLVVEHRMKASPVPEDLMPQITYTGDASWLMLHLGEWGHVYIDVSRCWGTAVLSPMLAARPDLISRCLLNTVLLNFCIHSGFGMLHASCLRRNGRVLLLLAPHNTGKSATALRLALAGYQLVSDSMVFVWSDGGESGQVGKSASGQAGKSLTVDHSPFTIDHFPPLLHPLSNIQLNAFPVGRTKLRADMTAVFPELHPLFTSEIVRDETKYTVDLRQLGDGYIYQEAIYPEAIDLCLLSRSGKSETEIQPATETAVWQAVMMNSLYVEETAVWERNLAQLKPLVQQARCYHLAIGTDPEGILRCLGIVPK